MEFGGVLGAMARYVRRGGIRRELQSGSFNPALDIRLRVK